MRIEDDRESMTEATVIAAEDPLVYTYDKDIDISLASYLTE